MPESRKGMFTDVACQTSSDTEVVGNLLAATQWLHLRDIDVIVADITNHIINPSDYETDSGSQIVVSTRHWQRGSVC
jgi:hypothetical protein